MLLPCDVMGELSAPLRLQLLHGLERKHAEDRLLNRSAHSTCATNWGWRYRHLPNRIRSSTLVSTVCALGDPFDLGVCIAWG
jgi:hypothetical protein